MEDRQVRTSDLWAVVGHRVGVIVEMDSMIALSLNLENREGEKDLIHLGIQRQRLPLIIESLQQALREARTAH